MDTLPPAPLPLSLSLSLSLCLSLSSRHATRPCSAFTGVTLAAGDRPPLTRSTRNSALPTCRAAEHSRTLAFAVSIRRRSEVDRQRERERERERETSAGRSENRFAPRARNRIDRAATVDSPAHPPYRNACRDKVRYIASPCLAPMLGSIPKEGADSSVVTARTRGHADGRAILNGNRAYDTVALSAAPPSFATSLAATSRSAATATTDTGPPHRSLNSV